MTTGVLAPQGDFREHIEVGKAQHLAAVQRLIIPGGESTTIGKLLVRFELLELLKERACYPYRFHRYFLTL